jgi:hypothetical protein
MRTGISLAVTAEYRRRLEAIVADRNTPQKHVWWARIVLLTTAGAGTNAIMREAGVSKAHSPAQLATSPSASSWWSAYSSPSAFASNLRPSPRRKPKIRVRGADRGDRNALQASRSQVGRYRKLALAYSRKRALLDELQRPCRDGSLVHQRAQLHQFLARGGTRHRRRRHPKHFASPGHDSPKRDYSNLYGAIEHPTEIALVVIITRRHYFSRLA